jgi:hypothetical protein
MVSLHSFYLLAAVTSMMLVLCVAARAWLARSARIARYRIKVADKEVFYLVQPIRVIHVSDHLLDHLADGPSLELPDAHLEVLLEAHHHGRWGRLGRSAGPALLQICSRLLPPEQRDEDWREWRAEYHDLAGRSARAAFLWRVLVRLPCQAWVGWFPQRARQRP